MHLLKRLLTLILIFNVAFSFGQNATSSSMFGNINDSKGAPVIGAIITAVHTPSGSIS